MSEHIPQTKCLFLLSESRAEVAAQAAKIAALQETISDLRADVVLRVQSYAALSAENEKHHRMAKTATKDRDREASRAKNLQDALSAAEDRIKSLEESSRRLLESFDASS